MGKGLKRNCFLQDDFREKVLTEEVTRNFTYFGRSLSSFDKFAEIIGRSDSSEQKPEVRLASSPVLKSETICQIVMFSILESSCLNLFVE